MTTTAVDLTHPARTALPRRQDVLDVVLDTISWRVPQAGGLAALQGPSTAAEAWLAARGATDLDIWADDEGYAVLEGLMSRLQGARVQHADDPARLRHSSWLVETSEGPAVIDVTRGDLTVGPVRLVPQRAITVRPGHVLEHTSVPRLAGAAAAADLFVRPLLRGKVAPDARLAEARSAWAAASDADRSELVASLDASLGRRIAASVDAVLEGAEVPPRLRAQTRRAFVRATLLNPAAAWRQRRVIVPAGRRTGIAGVRSTGVLVVLVGTDGSGKSTLADTVAARLEALGVETTPAYMGMARGNLPGVALARRLLGVPTPTEQAEAAISASEVTSTNDAAADGESDARGASDGSLQHGTIRRVAAWFYAGEYLYRYARDIRPHRSKSGRPAVVISDRYVYDLQDSPWPGSKAATVARRLMPRPDVLLVPDAPDAVIHARKPERPAWEQAAQQAAFRQLVVEQPGTRANLIVDTSGEALGDPVAPVIASIVEAMHRNP